MKCSRCEAVGRKPKTGKHDVIGPNGVKSRVCDECLEEIKYFVGLVEYENEED